MSDGIMKRRKALQAMTGSFCCLLVPLAIWTFPAAGEEATGSFQIEQCSVAFLEEVDVPALESGPIIALNVELNDFVEQDQLLARLDDSQLQVQRRIADIKGTLLDRRLSSELEVELANMAYQDAKLTADADARLHQSSPGSVPQLKLQKSQLSLRRAELERERVDDQRREAELQLQVHRAETEFLDHRLRRLSVQSPLSGIVLETVKRRGEWVNQGETIATVARLDRLRVTAILNESQLSMRSAKGTPVAIHWQEGSQDVSLRGTITSLDPLLHREQRYRVHIDIENRKLENGWLLLPGRDVRLTVYPRTSEQLQMPPSTARRLGLPQGGLR